MPDSKGQFKSNTVSHFKRASNHNHDVVQDSQGGLFHISKEHQITTGRQGRGSWHELFHISKEHQITTKRTGHACLPYCFTFQKSIKSQPRRRNTFGSRTVSHFKRASNHNAPPPLHVPSLLFHISKEHQITTMRTKYSKWRHCFTFQKSIKSQPGRWQARTLHDCFTFQKSIKSQLTLVEQERHVHCFTFQKSIKSQLILVDILREGHCFTFQKSIKSQLLQIVS